MGVECTHSRTLDLRYYDKVYMYRAENELLQIKNKQTYSITNDIITICSYQARPHTNYLIVFIGIHLDLNLDLASFPTPCLREGQIERVATLMGCRRFFPFYSTWFRLVGCAIIGGNVSQGWVDVSQRCTETAITGKSRQEKSQEQTSDTQACGRNDTDRVS